MCVTTFTTPKLIGVWASSVSNLSLCHSHPYGSLVFQMLFEVLVIFSTVLNALDRPHQAELRVAKTLYRDGIIYFCVSFHLMLGSLRFC